MTILSQKWQKISALGQSGIFMKGFDGETTPRVLGQVIGWIQVRGLSSTPLRGVCVTDPLPLRATRNHKINDLIAILTQNFRDSRRNVPQVPTSFIYYSHWLNPQHLPRNQSRTNLPITLLLSPPLYRQSFFWDGITSLVYAKEVMPSIPYTASRQINVSAFTMYQPHIMTI